MKNIIITTHGFIISYRREKHLQQIAMMKIEKLN